EKVDAGRIAARPGKACYETKLDRVLPDGKHDGYRSGCGFRRECRSGSSGRGNHGYLPPRQIVSQLGQSTVIPVRPAEFDGSVVAFGVAGVAEALSKSGDDLRPFGCGRRVEISDSPASPAAPAPSAAMPLRHRGA